MDVKLKQRLIGAIVILALIVIFVPMLFSKHKKENIVTVQSIPQVPEQPKVDQGAQPTATETTQGSQSEIPQIASDTMAPKILSPGEQAAPQTPSASATTTPTDQTIQAIPQQSQSLETKPMDLQQPTQEQQLNQPLQQPNIGQIKQDETLKQPVMPEQLNQPAPIGQPQNLNNPSDVLKSINTPVETQKPVVNQQNVNQPPVAANQPVDASQDINKIDTNTLPSGSDTKQLESIQKLVDQSKSTDSAQLDEAIKPISSSQAQTQKTAPDGSSIKQPSVAIQETIKTSEPAKLDSNAAAKKLDSIEVKKQEFKNKSVKNRASQKTRIAKAKSLKNGWAVQLGYFADQKNATNLIKKLRANGFTAFDYKTHTENGTLTHVYAGPTTKMELAQVMRGKIKNKLSVEGIVIKYNAAHLHAA